MTYEIYLTKKKILKEEWQALIEKLSHYHGYFKKWKIQITNKKNEIRYFIKTSFPLPATINHLDFFLLKETEENLIENILFVCPIVIKIKSSLLDLLNQYEIKRRGIVSTIEITFQKRTEQYMKQKIKFWLKKEGRTSCYSPLLVPASTFLEVDFENNKRYFFKSAPKYLNIQKMIPLLAKDPKSACFRIETFPYIEGEHYLKMDAFDFQKHSLMCGSSGSGKSKCISLMIFLIESLSYLKEEYKIIIIDPHASLEEEIGGLGKVIDFQTPEDSIELFFSEKEEIISSTELTLELLKSLLQDQYNAKLERVLRHAIYLLLTANAFCFTTLRKLLLDLDYKNELIETYKEKLPSAIIDFFATDFNELKTKSYGEAISPILSFLDEMEILPVFNSSMQMPNLEETLKANFLTIFSLNRSKLGDKITKTISGLLNEQLFLIMQKKQIKEHILLIIDEVASLENPILKNFLSEARKYHLSLILISQYLNQISESLKDAVYANVINYYIFRLSKSDATLLADNLDIQIPLDDSRNRKIKMLTELNNRECVLRVSKEGKLIPACKATTLDVPIFKREKIKMVQQKCKKENQSTKEFKFEVESNIQLKDILNLTSSSKMVIENE